MPEVRSTFQLQPGAAMPGFHLADGAGRWHGHEECVGERGTIVVFACNHCPFVVHLAWVLGEKAKAWKSLGVATVAIAANDVEAYPQDGPGPMVEFAKRHGWEFPYLLDKTQEVALAYGAACTPDIFLFDAAGKLFYAGQFDATRPGSGTAPDGKDLVAAIEAMLAGGPAPRGWPASGCSIKWKAENKPDWWNAG